MIYSLSGKETTGSGGTLVSASNVQVPEGNEQIGEEAGLLKAAGAKHTYTLTVKFIETASDQNTNQGKSFAGKIEVRTGSTSEGELYYTDKASSGQTTVPEKDDTISNAE